MNLRSARASAWLEISDIGGLVGLGTILLLDLVSIGVVGALNLLWSNLIKEFHHGDRGCANFEMWLRL